MLQHDIYGDALFLHANLMKFIDYSKAPKHAKADPWQYVQTYANSHPYLFAGCYNTEYTICCHLIEQGTPVIQESFDRIAPGFLTMYRDQFGGPI
jgi:hypothetical protein